MNISDIQKKKFLDNVYRLLYSTGISETEKVVRKPDEREVKRLFDEYFSQNRIGVPLGIDLNLLRNTPILDPDLMNILMSRSLLNLEVLYDSIDENTKKLMDTITVLNKKFYHLKDKRAALEAKVDNLLFSLSNTDGYFYSFSDSFANLDNVDLSLTSAFVDTENRKVTLPRLKSSVFEFNAPGAINLQNVTYSTYFNGSVVQEGRSVPDVNNLFDGLTNTHVTIEHSSDSAGACALVLNIPLNTPFIVSKIDGRLSTSSAVAVVAEIVESTNVNNVQFKRKQSNSDYDRFSFDFMPQTSGTIRLTLVKYEPDIIDLTQPNNRYKYIFTFKDLVVSGAFYDANATFVSSPLKIPAGDNNKIIDAVSVECINQNYEAGEVNYFVAVNVAGATSVSDYNWIPISSLGTSNPSFDQIVSFEKSNKITRSLKQNPSENDIALYPISTENNLSTLNPSSSIYNGISVYRIGKIEDSQNLYNPYILDAINQISFKYTTYVPNLYLDKQRWSSIINRTLDNFQVFEPGNIKITNSPSIPITLNLSGISGYLSTSILTQNATSFSSRISRTGNAVDWDMAVYVNGSLLTSMQSGQAYKDVTWQFVEGINEIVVTYDAEGSSSGSISLMNGISLSNYGSVFLNYYSYVDSFDFRINRSATDKVFTIDTYLGNKEILCRSIIQDDSRIIYRSNQESKIESIRFRADLSRFNNQYATPSLISYRVKFKNSI